MSISSPFIERPIATSLLMLAILLSGILGYQMLSVSSLPEVDYPTIQVLTFYPGASPDVMASSVTAPLERQFGQMPGLNQMTSNSSSGSSVIVMQFNLKMDLDVAEQEVQAAINAATNYLPAELPVPPIYNKVNPADAPIMTLALTSNKYSLPQVEDYADTRLLPKIAEVSGVGLVTIGGGQRPAVRIQANPTALSAYGLTLENVRGLITNANINAAKGSFDGPRLSYVINSNDQLLSSEEYRPLILAYNNGAPVRLSDVANVIDDAENVKQAAWMNEQPAVILNIQRQPGANVIDVADRITALLPRLKTILPPEINVVVLTDRTITIRASVKDVQLELMLSVLLVVLVIFFFLRNLPATIIPSIVVPLSLIGTFGAMYLFNFSLNNLTLMALTIAAGFVVDDAIVMIENITRYIERGEDPVTAAQLGAKQISFTIITLSVSLIAVLIPLLFMQGLIGSLFREFALTLSFTIIVSAFISLTLTPMMCSRILHKNTREIQWVETCYEKTMNPVMEKYHRSLNWVLDHQKETLIVALLTLVLTALLFVIIPKGFFPLQDTGVIQGISEASESISFKAMVERQKALTKVVLSDHAVENISSFIGIDGVNTTLNSGRILITLKPLAQRDATAAEVIRRLQPKLAKVPGIVLYMQAVQDLTIDDRVSRTQYQYSIGSPNGDEVKKYAQRLVDKLQKSRYLRDVASDQQNNSLQTWINIDRDTAYRLGITTQMIDDTLYDAFGQRQISTMYTQRNQYHVVLEVLPELQQRPSALSQIYINSLISNSPTSTLAASASTSTPRAVASTPTSRTPTAASTSNNNTVTSLSGNNISVPLSVFTQISEKSGPLVINRQGQFPVATISFNLAPNAALGDAVKEIHAAEKEIQFPESIQAGFEGSAKIFENSLGNEGWLVLAAIVVVYIVLGVLYESYIHPVTILSTLPSAAMGALLALLLTRNSLSVIALIGIILLIGIVMKNAIMMIDFALDQERTYNKPPREAIFEAAMLRFRPIIMTTMASFFGAIPIAIGAGMGAELRQPLGIAILGGLAFSQLLTLYTTPVIYITFDGISRRLTEWDVRGAHPSMPPQEL